MVRKVSLLVAFWLLAGFLLPGVIYASYGYYIPITVYNNDSSEWSGSALITLNNSQLVEMGYITDGTDTEVLEGATERSHTVADSRLGLFIPELLSLQERTYHYRLGVDPSADSFPIVFGEGGYVTVADHADLELGDTFTLAFTGMYVDTDAGSNKDILIKTDAVRFYVSSTTDGTITFEVSGGASVSATGIPTGEYDIVVVSDATDLELYVNGVLKGTATMTAAVVDNTNSWVFFKSNVVGYIGSFKMEN